MIDTYEVSGITYWIPENDDDVLQIVNEAHKNKEVIVVRGAAHSFPLIEKLETAAKDGRPYRFVLLSKMDAVKIDADTGIATVESGCHLGWDPYDVIGISHERNSFLYQIDKAGWALSDLGGITHQTIGGFMSTGSSGGSTRYSFDKPLISIEIAQFIDGAAQVVTYRNPYYDSDGKLITDPNHKVDPDDPFFGVCISMGLMGIILRITVQCDPKFYITGSETISLSKDSQVDMFSEGIPGKPDMETYLTETEFTRIMWWPQQGVNKAVVWKAKKATETEAISYASAAYQKEGIKDHPPLKEYEEVPFIFGSAAPATLGADFIYSTIGRWPDVLKGIFVNPALSQAIDIIARATFMPFILPKILDVFVPLDGEKGPQLFADVGWKGLPMDNRMSDKLFPVKFTELWIPIEKSTAVMQKLHDFYEGGMEHTGAFSCEIYAAMGNECWLSPAYGTNVIRIDVFWYGNNIGTPEDFYSQFWACLAEFDYRPHWGKYLPPPDHPIKSGKNDIWYGPDKLKTLYPKWDQWMQLRQKVDPDQIFLNDYWREHLGIKHFTKYV